MPLPLRALPAFFMLFAAWTALPAQEPTSADPSGAEFFEKRIRPLFAEHCYQCHSVAKKRSGLVLENVAGLVRGGERGPALVPGHPEQSLLIRAIEQVGELHMPPKGKLSPQQIADVTSWVKKGAPVPKEVSRIEQGAKNEFDLAERLKHWAYQPVKLGPLPTVKNASWCKSPVDFFILNGLEKANLAPAPTADRRALIRRVTFDLIGLPPTPQDVDAFLADSSSTAFAKVVDRLLASPHYGERWARHWLDLVRFAESLGFEFDYDLHNAWRYRDYVIRAFNADLPYDQFVIEHLAGDLLPRPRRHPTEGTNESILATGFFWMGEARQTPIDIRQEQADVIDNQIDVLTKALLAQTVACARCHDHKFDAIPTKDYYSLVGYLKSSRYQQAFIDPPERRSAKLDEMASLHSTIREMISAEVTPLWLAELEKAHHYLLAAATKGKDADVRLDPARVQQWMKAIQQIDASDSSHPLHAWIKQAAAGNDRESRQRLLATLADEGGKASHSLAAASSFEDFRQESFAGWQVSGDAFGRGPAQMGDILLGENANRPVTQFLSGGAHSGLLSNRLQGEMRSRTFTVDKRYVHVRLAGRSARVNLVIDGNTLIMNPIYGGLTLPIKEAAEADLVWRTMPVDRWIGHRGYFEICDSVIPMHRLNPPPSTARVPEGPQDGAITVDRICFSDDANPPATGPNGRNIQALDLAKDGNLPTLAAAYQSLMIDEAKRWQALAAGRPSDTNASGNAFTLLNWLTQNGLLDMPNSSAADKLNDLLKKYRQLEASLSAPQRAPALADGTGEDEHVFLRGNYKTLGPLAPRGPPIAMGATVAKAPKADAGSGRLELANRLVDPSNPLLARVLVNRLWHHHFGQGLVRTPDDFGRMGLPPTHPELLDTLAADFMQSGWSIKTMHRRMLLSSTYQMASRSDLSIEKLDPENRLWHRMNIRRLEGESIRDAVLAVSGRLDPAMYGPSVLPYLTKYMEGRGRPATGPLDGDGRRSIYLNVRRNFLTPMLVAFDYPTTFTTMGRRSVTSVPGQALTLMNDPFVVQQADLWAERSLAHPAKASDRIDLLYRTAFARIPSDGERENALAFLRRHENGVEDARAWADLCHVLINVKEFIFLD